MIQKSSFFVLRNVEIIFFVPIAVSEVTVHCYFGCLMAFCVLNIRSMIREGKQCTTQPCVFNVCFAAEIC